jgi:microcystin-dependent protein
MAVDPTDATEPTDASLAEEGQLELRKLKAYMQGVLGYDITGGVISRVGDIIWSANQFPQAGRLACNGQAVSRVTYANLFAACGTVFGIGDGATTFNIPDLRGRTMFGFDAANASGRLTAASTGGINANTVGNSGGTQNHVLALAELALHTHTIGVSVSLSDPTHTHAFTGTAHNHGITDPQHHHNYATVTPGAGALSSGLDVTSGLFATSDSATGITINNATAGGTNTAAATGVTVSSATGSASNTGSSTAFNSVPPGLVLYPYIKT